MEQIRDQTPEMGLLRKMQGFNIFGSFLLSYKTSRFGFLSF